MRLPMLAAAVAASMGCAHAQTVDDSPRAILERFAADYAQDPALKRAATVGVRVGDQWWTITATPGEAGGPGQVSVSDGPPPEPTLYFAAELETLRLVDRGEMAGMTAMVKARSTDYAPMDFDFMEGFEPFDGLLDWALPFVFHFWTRGQPEIFPFNSDATRFTHGAQGSVLYYQPGFRSVFVEIRPGQHANREADDQVNPFPTLMIFTEGRVRARIGGREIVLNGGESVFVPANVAHEFWNDFDTPAQGFMIAFGDGA